MSPLRFYLENLLRLILTLNPLPHDHYLLDHIIQVAAVLGSDGSKDGQRGSAGRYTLRPAAAAEEVLLRGGEPLGLEFFHSEPLSLKRFGPEDLEGFNKVGRYSGRDEGEGVYITGHWIKSHPLVVPRPFFRWVHRVIRRPMSVRSSPS